MIWEVSVGLDFQTGLQERDPDEHILSITSTYLNTGGWIRMRILTKGANADREEDTGLILGNLLGEEVGEKMECN